MAVNQGLRVEGIAETLRLLERELGDNGKVYRKTIQSIKRAGEIAVNRSRGYLPQETDLPSGFAYKNTTRFRREIGNTGKRPFPRYDGFAARNSIRVVSARERSVMTDHGWRGGKMYGIAVEMRDPAGSVYDVAGNGKSRRQAAKRSSDPKSRFFIQQLRKAWTGDPKWRFRVVLPAVVDTRPEIIADIKRILELARYTLDAKRDGTWRSIE